MPRHAERYLTADVLKLVEIQRDQIEEEDLRQVNCLLDSLVTYFLELSKERGGADENDRARLDINIGQTKFVARCVCVCERAAFDGEAGRFIRSFRRR